jgi:hypothetical protein
MSFDNTNSPNRAVETKVKSFVDLHLQNAVRYLRLYNEFIHNVGINLLAPEFYI